MSDEAVDAASGGQSGTAAERLQRCVMIVTILSSFVAFLDGSVVNVALPAIRRELGGGLSTQQWVVDAYLITLGALMLVAGSFSDRFGRVRILRIGLIGFGATSALCAVAFDPVFLVVSRGLQGMAGALLVPSSLALIISAFSGAAQGRAIGRWTAWTGTAMIAGPILGGVFVDLVSWRLVFAINLLPIAVTLWLLPRLRPLDARRRTAAEHSRIDFTGTVLCVLGLGGPVFALIEYANFGWASPAIWLPLLIGAGCFAVFIGYERRTPGAMVPPSLFAVRNFAVGNVSTMFMYGALSAGGFLITVFVQQVGGYPATAAGLAMLPTTLIMLAFSTRIGTLAARIGPRIFMTVGPIVAGLGYLYMLVVDERVTYWTQILPGVLIFGIGLTITVAPLTTAILGSVRPELAGTGSAVNNAISRVAGLIAIAVLGIVLGDTVDLAGFKNALIFCAALLIAGGVVSGIGIRNPAASGASDGEDARRT